MKGIFVLFIGKVILHLLLPPDSNDIVFRFLAGLCKHSSCLSCQQVGDLALEPNNYAKMALQYTCSMVFELVRCVYESDSIVTGESREVHRLECSVIISN